MEMKPWAQWFVSHRLTWLMRLYAYFIMFPVLAVLESFVMVLRTIGKNWRHARNVDAFLKAQKAPA